MNIYAIYDAADSDEPLVRTMADDTETALELVLATTGAASK